MLKNLFLWLIIAVVLITVFANFGPRKPVTTPYTYSQFIKAMDAGKISSVVIQNQTVSGVTKGNKKFTTYLPSPDPNLATTLVNLLGRWKSRFFSGFRRKWQSGPFCSNPAGLVTG